MARRAAAVLARAVRAAAEHASDRDLLHRYAAAGDQAAFAAVVGRHSAMVLGVCRRVLHSRADAEDACQAVFLTLATKAKSVRWQPSAANWLYATARKVAGNARVAVARRAKREGAAAVPERVDPTDGMTGAELVAALDEELDKLPPRYREPLVLCYLEGLTRDEAAARLGVPDATLKSQLERGRKRLADALTARGCGLGVALLLATASPPPAGACPPGLLAAILAAADGRPSAAAAALAHGVAVNGLLVRTTLGLLAAVAAVAGLGFASLAPIAAEPPGVGAQGADAPRSDDTPPPPKAKPGERVVTGRVVGPDGKPVAGAELSHPYSKVPDPTTEADLGYEALGRTDADGRFTVALKKPSPREYLIARHPGFGVDWVEFDKPGDPAKPVELRLPADQPITGRVVNTEGKPVAGVRVSVASVYVPKDDDLDAYLAGWRGGNLRETMSSPVKRLYLPPDAIAGGAVTDADGRFNLTGAGAERIVYVLFEGAGIARSRPQVITRKGFDPKPYTDVLLKKEHDDLRVLNRFLGPLPPDLVFVAEPGRAVVGTVTDPDGKPVAGCRVGASTGWGDGVEAVTGKDGTYKLDGVPRPHNAYAVHAEPPTGSDLMAAHGSSPVTEGLGPIRVDVTLARGAVVVGRVIDKATGKGVRAGVRLAPLPNNTFFGKTPGSDSYRTDRTMKTTDADGRFRIPTIPGPALLMAQVHDGEKFHGEHLNPYRRAVPDPAHVDLFKYDADDDDWTVTAVDNSLEFLNTEQAVKVVEVKEKGETAVDLTVERGVTGTIEVRDADGKPLAGAWVAGLTHAWPITYKLPEATATVYALDPAKPRTVAVFHPGKKLGGVATVRGDEKEPVVVKLAAVGTVTGRFVEDGLPLAGAEVSVNPPNRTFSELYRFALKDRGKVTTAADGTFTLPDVVPGMPFYFQIHKGDGYFGGKPKLGLQTLKPGETKALGERAVEPLR